MSAHETLVAAWYERVWWLWLLRPVEFLFRFISVFRRACYRFGVLSTSRGKAPLIVVGNITVGGTGKTPVVIALVEYLQARGLRPGVVSRGYGATAEEFPHTLSANSKAGDCGDEALLIYQRTGCPVVVAPDRPAAVRQLESEFNVDILLSDDGLQHYSMERDMEIAVVDSRRGVGNGFCLPAGPLREPCSRLADMAFILYRGSCDPINGVLYRCDSLVNLKTGEVREFSTSEQLTVVHAVAGIGQPSQFFSTLRNAGFEPTEHCFADHHRYTADDFAPMSDKPVLMTEKDAVKCREFAGENCWYLKITAEIPSVVTDAVSALAKG
ncbi:MAG: tetraacyldisaccharide 4'-kinase [Halieaceae bacterium]|jgi:tetraacyldisaccharide 4'-kinase